MPVRAVIDQLVELGWSDAQATGIAANLQAESNFRPDAVGDGGKAYGIAQWHPDRQADFESAFGKPIQGSTLAEQVAFIDYELRQGKEQAAGKRLLAANSAGDAAGIVSQFYERPRDTQGEIAKRTRIANDMAGTIPSTNNLDQASADQISALGADVVERSNLAADALEAMMAQQGAIFNKARESYQSFGEDAAHIATVEELAKSKAQLATYNFAQAAGAIPGVANEALYKLIQQSNAVAEEQRAVAASLANAADPRQLYSDPLRWISDYLLEPFNAKRLDALNKQQNATQGQIKSINDSVQQYRQTQDAVAQTKTVSSAAAAARQAQAKANIDVAKLDLQEIQTNAAGLRDTLKMRNTSYEIAVQDYRFKIQAETLKEQRAAAAERAAMLKTQMEDRATEQDAKNSILSLFNLGMDTMGMPKYDSYTTMMGVLGKLGKVGQDILAQGITAGMAVESGETPTLAATPIGASELVHTMRPMLDPGRKQLIERIDRTVAGLSESETTVNGRKSKDLTNSSLFAKARQYASNILENDNNFYQPPPVETLLSDENFAKTHIGSKIMPAFKGTDAKIAYPKVVEMLLMDLKQGKIHMDEADSELGYMAAKIRGYNNDMYRYAHTAGLPVMDSVKFKVPVPYDPTVFNRTVGTVLGAPFNLGAMTGATILGVDYDNSIPTQPMTVDFLDPVSRSELFNRVMATNIKPPHPGRISEGTVE